MKTIARVLPPETKVLIVPIDHGLAMGNVAGLEDPSATLQVLASNGVDGTLMSPGAARRLGGVTAEHQMSLTVTLDFQLLGEKAGDVGSVRGVAQACSVRQALELGADAVKVLFVWGAGDDLLVEDIKLIATVLEEAHLHGIPVMVEPLWFGSSLNEDEHEDFVVHAARIAFELGADILKVPVVGIASVEAMLRWGAPIVFLGGVKQNDPRSLLAGVKAGLEAGVSGVVIGRNVWQSDRMQAVLTELRGAIGA